MGGEILKELAAQSQLMDRYKKRNNYLYDPNIFLQAIELLLNKKYDFGNLELIYYFNKLSSNFKYGYGSLNLFILDLHKAEYSFNYFSKNNKSLFKRLSFLKKKNILLEENISFRKTEVDSLIDDKKVRMGKGGKKKLIKLNWDKIQRELGVGKQLFLLMIEDMLIGNSKFKFPKKFYLSENKFNNFN